MTTYSMGVERKRWPSEGGLSVNTCAPGMVASLGRSSSVICCCFFVRSSQGLRRNIAVPSTTVGKPEMAVYANASGTWL